MRTLRLYTKSRFKTCLFPTAKKLEEAIRALDNSDHTVVQLLLPRGILTIWGGNDSRVQVSFTNSGKPRRGRQKTGILVDAEYSKQDSDIELMGGDGIVDDIPLFLTVSKDIATRVAVHFLTYQTLPTGMMWDRPVDEPVDVAFAD